MNRNFETPSRCCATGVITAAMLVVMLVMGASTLFTTDAPASASWAGSDSGVQIVRSQPSGHNPRS